MSTQKLTQNNKTIKKNVEAMMDKKKKKKSIISDGEITQENDIIEEMEEYEENNNYNGNMKSYTKFEDDSAKLKWVKQNMFVFKAESIPIREYRIINETSKKNKKYAMFCVRAISDWGDYSSKHIQQVQFRGEWFLYKDEMVAARNYDGYCRTLTGEQYATFKSLFNLKKVSLPEQTFKISDDALVNKMAQVDPAVLQQLLDRAMAKRPRGFSQSQEEGELEVLSNKKAHL